MFFKTEMDNILKYNNILLFVIFFYVTQKKNFKVLVVSYIYIPLHQPILQQEHFGYLLLFLKFVKYVRVLLSTEKKMKNQQFLSKKI